MNLQELKNHLNIIDIARELGLQLDKHKKCLCPFHKENTASLQFSEQKQIATCFSSKCSAGTMDVIGLVQKYYSWDLPRAIEWLKPKAHIPEITPANFKALPTPINYSEIFTVLQAKYAKSTKAQTYLQDRFLTSAALEVGYNPSSAYAHLKYCVVFPLKNKQGEIVSLYGRSTMVKARAKHFYTTHRKGLYPSYPKPTTKKLILTESIIDAATLAQHFLPSIENTGILALYGTNGFTAEHSQAIASLPKLEEIIFWMDGDAAGKAATEKYKKELGAQFSNITLSSVPMLEGEDVNSLLESHESSIYKHQYKQRAIIKAVLPPHVTGYPVDLEKLAPKTPTAQQPRLSIQANYSVYKNEDVKIELMGKVDLKDLSRLRVTTVIHDAQHPDRLPCRNNVDLYNDDQVEKLVRKVSPKLEVGRTKILHALNSVTQDLERYRLEQQDKKPQLKKERYPLRKLSQQEKTEAQESLTDPKLIQNLQAQLQQIGVIGEEKNALFLLIILISRKTDKPLNAVVQGTSGSGKSHLIKKVADCMYNQNKIKRFTRVTDKSFYNYGETDLCHTGIILEDYDGLTEEAELAWRELQSNDKLTSSVSQKNEQTGEISTGEKYVFGPIASLVATTNFRIYEDNESRVFVIAIDESEAQTERVLEYMAKKASKEITSKQEQAIVQQLQNKIHLLQPYKVKNPYRLSLPKTTHHRRRLTQMLHDYIEQVTILHQYQRTQENNLLITELQDVETAIDLMFNSIVLKTDELDGILRQFYEDLKIYVEKKGKNYEFTQREVRQEFRVSKTQMFRYIKELEELEYIQRSAIGARNVHKYKISYWDNIEKLRQELKAHLSTQIESYKQ